MSDTAWAHSKRMNRIVGAKSDAEWRQLQAELEPPKRKVPVELDPRNFDHHVGISEETNDDLALAKARRAFARYGEKLKDWQQRERTIYQNKYEPRVKKRMLTSRMVRNELDKNVGIIDEGRKTVQEEIKGIDRAIERGFMSRLPEQKAAEIRQHMKGLSAKERRALLGEGDPDVLSAVLSAKPFLSGMTPQDAVNAKHNATQQLFPDEIKRRAKLEKSLELLDNANDIYWKTVPEMVDPEVGKFEQQTAAMNQAVRGGNAA